MQATQIKESAAKKKWRKAKKYWPIYLMLLPAVAYLIINNYLPMGGLVLAFKRFNAQKGIWGSDFVGLENFEFLLKNKSLPLILRNTVGYNLLFILVDLVVGVLIALLITEIRSTKMRQLYQSSVLFPFVVSIIIVSYMVRGFLDYNGGLVNAALKAFGQKPVNWYSQKKYWPFILTFVHTWKGVGYGCLLYIATLLGIDATLYEAAALDGASRLQQIRHITLPHLVSPIVTVTLLSVGRIFSSDFGLFYQVPQNSGIIQSVTQTIDTFVYKSISSNIGMGSAAGFFQSITGLMLIVFFNWVARKVSAENALY